MAPNRQGGPPSFAPGYVDDSPTSEDDNKIISSDEVKARGCGTDEFRDTFAFPRDELRVWFTGEVDAKKHTLCSSMCWLMLMAARQKSHHTPPPQD